MHSNGYCLIIFALPDGPDLTEHPRCPFRWLVCHLILVYLNVTTRRRRSRLNELIRNTVSPSTFAVVVFGFDSSGRLVALIGTIVAGCLIDIE